MNVNLSPTELSSLLPSAETATRNAKAPATSFASLHAASMAKLSTASKTTSAETATAAKEPSKSTDSKSATPKNETYQAVKGQPYEEIVSGPRNGMFINRSGNQRDGEAFVLVKRNGREFHIYGTGTDRQVVPVGKRESSSATSVTGGEKVVSGTTYRDVPGRAFDEIVSGPRNGMFVNRSGNERDGEAFVLVKRADHELHIYGKGKDRLVVRVVPPEQRDGTATPPKTEAVEKPAAGSTPTTGAVTAPSSGASSGTPTSSSILLS